MPGINQHDSREGIIPIHPRGFHTFFILTKMALCEMFLLINRIVVFKENHLVEPFRSFSIRMWRLEPSGRAGISSGLRQM